MQAVKLQTSVSIKAWLWLRECLSLLAAMLQTLRDLVCDAAAEKVATRLISCLVTQQLDSASPAGGSAAASVGEYAQVHD
jgi:hypothetical protein